MTSPRGPRMLGGTQAPKPQLRYVKSVHGSRLRLAMPGAKAPKAFQRAVPELFEDRLGRQGKAVEGSRSIPRGVLVNPISVMYSMGTSAFDGIAIKLSVKTEFLGKLESSSR